MNHKLRLTILARFQTQSDFAIEIGEHESKISQVVRGRRELNPEAQDAWAKALDCETSEIFPEINVN